MTTTTTTSEDEESYGYDAEEVRKETEAIRELRDLAERIGQFAEDHDLSQRQLCKRYREELGSERNFAALKAGQTEGRAVAKWLIGYRTVWNQLDTIGIGSTPAEPIIKSMWAAVELKRAVGRAMLSESNSRTVLMIADTGCGKTHAVRNLVETFGSRVIVTEANATWGVSPGPMLFSILRALGISNPPKSNAAKLALIVEMLNQGRRCLIIEEGHKMSPLHLDLCSTLINETPGELVITAFPTLWRRLESGSAYEEARQLIGNRLCARIVIDKPVESDIRKYLKANLAHIAPKEIASIITYLKANGRLLKKNGNLALVRDTCRRCNDDDPDTKHTAESWLSVLNTELANR